jgi:hypothetical protein
MSEVQAEGLAAGGGTALRRLSLWPVVLAVALLAAVAAYVLPRGMEARHLISIANDPVQIADRALSEKFNADVARREIDQALAANDADLARSFVDLANERHVALDAEQVKKVDAAVAEAGSAAHAAESFAQGLVTGEPHDGMGLAGTTLGDLFVFGDIRDAAREGARLATGQQADELVLGLACVGIAITAGTYASLGVGAPARVGLTLAKVARKSGKLGGELALYIGRALREVVDMGQLRRALASASLSEPAVAVRAARDAVKLRRASGLVDLARDVGTIERKAGTRAAMDSLKVAENPRAMSRIAKLAEKEGGRTRAILKVAGRGAIFLTGALFDLGFWILGALFTLFSFVCALKNGTERLTLRLIRRGKERRRRRALAGLPVLAVAQG